MNVINEEYKGKAPAQSAKVSFTVPTDIIKLPSKGYIYPKGSPLSKGEVEMKVMTAKEEDILTTQSFIKNNTVFDRLLRSMILDKTINIDDLLIGDLNALLLAARTLGYGTQYSFFVQTPSGKKQEVNYDLDELAYKELDTSLCKEGENLFKFVLPKSGDELMFKLLTQKESKLIDKEAENFKKMYGGLERQSTLRIAYSLVSVNGNTDKSFLKEYAENMRASDARAFRQYIDEIQPDVDLSINLIDEDTGEPFRSQIEFEARFFYPDLRV